MWWAIVFYYPISGHETAELSMAWGDSARSALVGALKKRGVICIEMNVRSVAEAEAFQASVRRGSVLR